MSNSSIMSVREMIDLAFGDPRGNVVDHKLIETILYLLARQLRMLERYIKIEMGFMPYEESDTRLSVTEIKLHALQKKTKKVIAPEKEAQYRNTSAGSEQETYNRALSTREYPAKDTPTRYTSARNTPAKDTPARDASAKHTPTKDTPAKDTLARDSPVRDTPEIDNPASDSPAKHTPTKDTPAKDTPSRDTLVRDISASSYPTKDFPATGYPSRDPTDRPKKSVEKSPMVLPAPYKTEMSDNPAAALQPTYKTSSDKIAPDVTPTGVKLASFKHPTSLDKPFMDKTLAPITTDRTFSAIAITSSDIISTAIPIKDVISLHKIASEVLLTDKTSIDKPSSALTSSDKSTTLFSNKTITSSTGETTFNKPSVKTSTDKTSKDKLSITDKSSKDRPSIDKTSTDQYSKDKTSTEKLPADETSPVTDKTSSEKYSTVKTSTRKQSTDKGAIENTPEKTHADADETSTEKPSTDEIYPETDKTSPQLYSTDKTKPSTHKKSTDKSAMEHTPFEKHSSDKTSTRKPSTDKISTHMDQTFPEIYSTDKTSTGTQYTDKSTLKNTPSEKYSTDKMSTGKSPTDKTSTGTDITPQQNTIDKTSTRKTSTDQISTGTDKTSPEPYTVKISTGKPYIDKKSTDKSAIEKTPEKYATDKIPTGTPTNTNETYPEINKTSTEQYSIDVLSTRKPSKDTSSIETIPSKKYFIDKSSTRKPISDKISLKTDKTSPEQYSTDKTYNKKPPTDQKSIDKSAIAKISPEKYFTDNTSTIKSSTDKTSNTAIDKISTDKTSTDKTSSYKSSTDYRSSSNKTSTDRTSTDVISTDKASYDKDRVSTSSSTGKVTASKRLTTKRGGATKSKRADTLLEPGRTPIPIASLESVEEAKYEKLLVVERVPSDEAKARAGADSRRRRSQLSVVTKKEFDELQEKVRKLLQRLVPIPTPDFPDYAQLMEDLRTNSSLTDAMAALQLSARLEATEKTLSQMLSIVTDLASKSSHIDLTAPRDETGITFGPRHGLGTGGDMNATAATGARSGANPGKGADVRGSVGAEAGVVTGASLGFDAGKGPDAEKGASADKGAGTGKAAGTSKAAGAGVVLRTGMGSRADMGVGTGVDTETTVSASAGKGAGAVKGAESGVAPGTIVDTGAVVIPGARVVAGAGVDARAGVGSVARLGTGAGVGTGAGIATATGLGAGAGVVSGTSVSASASVRIGTNAGARTGAGPPAKIIKEQTPKGKPSPSSPTTSTHLIELSLPQPRPLEQKVYAKNADGRLSKRDCVTYEELNNAMQELYDESMKKVTCITNRSTISADNAFKLAKKLDGDLNSALKQGNRMTDLEAFIGDYAEQINILDMSLSSQMTIYQDQLMQMQHDLETGLETMAEILANTGGDTVAVAELNTHFNNLQLDLDYIALRQKELKIDLNSLSLDMENFWKRIELLRASKSEREEVSDALRDKAGIGALNGMLSLLQFQAVRGDFEKRISGAYDTFNTQETVWQKAIDELLRVLNEKADLIQVVSLKNEINKHLNALRSRLNAMLEIVGEPRAAAITRKLHQDTACLSCSPAHMNLNEPGKVTAAVEAEATTKSKGGGDHGICYRGLPIPHQRDPRSRVCHRYCDDSHTPLGNTIYRMPPEVTIHPASRQIATGPGTYGKTNMLDKTVKTMEHCLPCNIPRTTMPSPSITIKTQETDMDENGCDDMTPPNFRLTSHLILANQDNVSETPPPSPPLEDD